MQQENKIALDSLSEINDEAILDDLLESVISDEFKTLSYLIFKNKLLDAKNGDEENENEFHESPSPSASPSISQEEELYRLDQHQQLMFCFGVLESETFSLFKDIHI